MIKKRHVRQDPGLTQEWEAFIRADVIHKQAWLTCERSWAAYREARAAYDQAAAAYAQKIATISKGVK